MVQMWLLLWIFINVITVIKVLLISLLFITCEVFSTDEMNIDELTTDVEIREIKWWLLTFFFFLQ